MCNNILKNIFKCKQLYILHSYVFQIYINFCGFVKKLKKIVVVADLFHPSQVGFDISSPVVKLQQAFPTYCCCYWHSSRSNKGRVFVLLQIFLDDGGFYHYTRRKGWSIIKSLLDWFKSVVGWFSVVASIALWCFISI